jgi:hypothetical protein
MRDELGRFVGNANYLMANQTLIASDRSAFSERLRGLFIQKSSVDLGLDLRDPLHQALNGALNEALRCLQAAIGTQRDDAAVDQTTDCLNQAVEYFYRIRVAAEERL